MACYSDGSLHVSKELILLSVRTKRDLLRIGPVDLNIYAWILGDLSCHRLCVWGWSNVQGVSKGCGVCVCVCVCGGVCVRN